MRARCAATVGLLVCMLAGAARAQNAAPPDPLPPLEHMLAAAEASLRAGELQIAESQYRAAMADGWLILGSLAAAEGRVRDARDQFKRASTLTFDAGRAVQALAIAHLQLSEADAALDVLNSSARTGSPDPAVRRLLAQALVAAGRPAEAVQELEETHAANPKDLELTFLLASGYLRLDKMDAAERLFATLVSARPIAETHVLIGRTYRDAAEYARARRELQAALKIDPRVRRAHYYLGTIDIMSEGIARLEPAIAAFEAELKLSPGDPPTSLGLGLALVHARRHADALPHLERAVTSAPLQGNGYYYLGRCFLGLNRAADAVTALQKSLDLSNAASGAVERKNIHYQLGLALRAVGKVDEAATHFAQAEQAWDGRLAGDRERLSRYLADTPEPQSGNVAANMADALPFADVPAAARSEMAARVRRALAGAYMNLGIMHAQASRFARASEFLDEAAALEPNLARVHYSLGVARFNATQYDKAVAPLQRALESAPGDADVRRMLALSLLNTEAYGRAAELLRNDPRRESDPSLQYAYGMALARSERGADAAIIFDGLLAQHGDRPDLHVMLGQAHAQQGDFDGAVTSLQHALALDPKVAEANRTLGIIYLRQGKFPEAIAVLKAELASHPGDLRAVHTLAAVYEMNNQADEAVPLLRSVLRVQPQHGDARYLLGKILLARGDAAEAVQHLETAARLSPDDASVHYQLGQAYLKTGRAAEAEQQFDLFRQIKDKRRGKTQ